MSAIQSWSGLPEHIKRQAAPDMLRGVEWQFWGVPAMNPGKEELCVGCLNLCGRPWVCPKE